MTSPSEPRTRIAAIDGLRALAALAVLGLNVWQASDAPVLDTPVGPFLTTLLAAGHIGADFFFVLSGFVLFLSVCLNGGRFGSTAGYFLRRAARIVPSYWVTLFVIVAGLPLLTTNPEASRLLGTNIYLHLTFMAHPLSSLAGLLEGFGVNVAVWTLSLQVTFYLVFPLFAARFHRRPAVWFAIFVIVSLLWRYATTTAVASESRTGPTLTGLALIAELPTYLTHFALGMASAWIYVRLRPGSTESGRRASGQPLRSATLRRWAAGMLVLGGLGVIWGAHLLGVKQVFGHGSPYGFFTETLPVTLAFTCALLGLLLGPEWLRRPFGNDALRIGGEISYGIYLWQLPVIALLSTNLSLPTGGTRHFVLWLGLVLPTTLALAWMSHVVIERPVIQWARRRTAPESPEDDARGPELPEHHLDARWLYGAFSVYVLLLGVLLLSPEPVERIFGVDLHLLQHSAEEIGNVLVFVPIGIAGAAWLPRRWLALVLGICLAVAVEMVQYVWLPDRTPALDDIVKNSIGTAIGVGLQLLVGHRQERRTRPHHRA